MRANSTSPLIEGNLQLPLVHLPHPASLTKTPNATGSKAPYHTPNVPAATMPTGMSRIHVPASHVTPNMSAWTFPAPSSIPGSNLNISPPVGGQLTITATTVPIVTTTVSFAPLVPIQSRGTTFHFTHNRVQFQQSRYLSHNLLRPQLD